MLALVLFLSLGGMFQRATVVQMDLTTCVAPHRSVLAALSGAPDDSLRESCAEYVIASASVVFRVQARKSEVLMVPGEVVSFRTGKGKLLVRRDDDGGELEATVLCMRSVTSPGDACGLVPEPFSNSSKTVRAQVPNIPPVR